MMFISLSIIKISNIMIEWQQSLYFKHRMSKVMWYLHRLRVVCVYVRRSLRCHLGNMDSIFTRRAIYVAKDVRARVSIGR